MISILKNTELGLGPMDQITNGCWVKVTNPDAEEVARLQQELGVPPDFVTYPLDMDEMARIEKEDGAMLIIIRVPHFQGEAADVPYTTVPLGFLVTDRLIATVCKQNTGILQDFAAGRVKGLSTAKRNRFVLQVLFATASRYLAYLREINKTVDALEDRLQRSLQNREVLELLKFQKSLVYFTTGLKSNNLMIERLHRSRLFEMYPDDEDLLEDVLTENQQAIQMTDIAGNILSQMMDAFASIISNNLNVVMKFLASATIILTLPTMIASFFGMNVRLPAQDLPHAFTLTVVASLAVMAVVGFVFWKKDWL